MRVTRSVWMLAVGLGCVMLARAQEPTAPDPLAARVDPYVEKQRVVVMTDIANEPDDQMSMVRFLVYSNQFDVEGLIATTSTWMKNKVRPDVIQHAPRRLRPGAAEPAAARSQASRRAGAAGRRRRRVSRLRHGGRRTGQDERRARS